MALTFGGVNLPMHLVVRASGLWACSDNLRLTRLAGAILAIALAHDEGKKHWKRVLYFRDRDGNDRTLFVPEQQLWQTPNKMVAMLINAGFEFASGDTSRVVQHLVQTSIKRRLIVMERPGWHGEHYVTECGTIGRRSTKLPVQAGSVGAAPRSSTGWQVRKVLHHRRRRN